MEFTLQKNANGYDVIVADYPNLKYTIVNTDIEDDAVYELVEESIDRIVQDHVDQSIEHVRLKRASEFALYDKYQLVLVWQDLTQQQRDEYIAWRSAWLDATTILIEPERLEWFN